MHRPKSAKGLRLMRGRPITTEEVERTLVATSKVQPWNLSVWTEYLKVTPPKNSAKKDEKGSADESTEPLVE